MNKLPAGPVRGDPTHTLTVDQLCTDITVDLQALAADGVDGVIGTLKAGHWFGVPTSDRCCPLALFLAARHPLPIGWFLRVTGSHIHILGADPVVPVSVRLPEVLSQFTALFDTGFVPQLDVAQLDDDDRVEWLGWAA